MKVSTTLMAQSHRKSVLQAMFVTFLWSTSWVLIKIGLGESLPAVTFAGLRYSLAFLCLAPFVLLNPIQQTTLRRLSPSAWIKLGILGVLFYSVTQGTQFVSLAFLPAATVSLLLNLSPMTVALLSGLIINEQLSRTQWGGVILSTVGVAIYFLPLEMQSGQVFGLTVAVIGVLANSGSSLLGRRVNQQSGLSPLLVTFASMGIGAFLLLIVGIAIQGFGELHAPQWAIIGWLAIINTAFAFTLWNHTLRTLTAVESSILNSTMLPQIVLLAWLFLGESLSAKQIIGLVLVGVGAFVAQLRQQAVIMSKSTANPSRTNAEHPHADNGTRARFGIVGRLK